MSRHSERWEIQQPEAREHFLAFHTGPTLISRVLALAGKAHPSV